MVILSLPRRSGAWVPISLDQRRAANRWVKICVTRTPIALASAQLSAWLSGVRGSVGDGGSLPVTVFHANVTSFMAATVVTEPSTPA